MTKQTYKISCERCGCEIVTTHHLQRYCTRCRADVRRETQRKACRRYKNKRVVNHKSVNEIIKELNAYNKEHNTSLTYGQYMLILEGVNGNN